MCLGSYPAFTPSSPSPSTPSSSSPSTPSTAPAASVTCNQQNEDPDQGINRQRCICTSGSTTKTLPILATGVDYASSCGYSNLATSTIAITQNFGPPTTNTMICKACTPTTDYGATCTSLPNCLPQTPSATIQIGSSPVPVGTLTSAALYTSISSAIVSLCPPTATACNENSQVKIGNIAYVDEDQLLTDGELIVQIDSSGYNDSSILNIFTRMAAQSFASFATGGNCADVSYTVEELRNRDHPYPVEMKTNMCNVGHFASPQYYSQFWREAPKPGPQDYLDVEITFGPGPGGELICAFIEGLPELVLPIRVLEEVIYQIAF